MRATRVLAVLASGMSITARGDDTPSASLDLSEIPACALDCLGLTMPQSTCDTAPSNYTCLCNDSVFIEHMVWCVLQKCTIKEALITGNISQTTCNFPMRSKTQQYRSISTALAMVTTTFIIQRFGYKIYAQTGLHLDDLFILLTVFIGIPCTVINTHKLTENGIGRDVWTITPEQRTNFNIYIFIAETLYFAAVSLFKLAMLSFYLRVFSGNWTRRLIWITIGVNSLVGVVYVLLSVFQCQPISYFWHRWDGEHIGKCMDRDAIVQSNAAISIALDFCMLALPLWKLRSLKLDWKNKLGVGLMFFVGTFVSIGSIVRLKAVIEFRSDTHNPTRDVYDLAIWSAIEINMGLICVCLPSLRQLLVKQCPPLLASTRRRYTRQSSSAQLRQHWISAPSPEMMMKPLPAVPHEDGNGFAFLRPVHVTGNGDLQLVVTDHAETRSSASDDERV